jgi:hypothetical protein
MTLAALEMKRAKATVRKSVTVRPAGIHELMRLHVLAARYYETVAHRPHDGAALAEYLLAAITHPAQCCFVIGEPAYGLICGTVAPHPRTGELVATKTAWWVQHRTRGAYLALQRAFEEWARGQNAKRVVMTAAAWAPRAGTFLERRGYRALETVYEKEI